MGLGANPYGGCPNEELQSNGSMDFLDGNALIVPSWEMMTYGWKVIVDSKDSVDCCNFEAVRLASST